ncbi:unnamed protein product, partial [Polarella glacialis]
EQPDAAQSWSSASARFGWCGRDEEAEYRSRSGGWREADAEKWPRDTDRQTSSSDWDSKGWNWGSSSASFCPSSHGDVEQGEQQAWERCRQEACSSTSSRAAHGDPGIASSLKALELAEGGCHGSLLLALQRQVRRSEAVTPEQLVACL